MSSTVSFNGSTYIIPATGDTGWGSNVSNYLIAIAAGCLQKTGGAFTLSAETDFGASFGLKSLYYKSRSSNIAASGIVRLANSVDKISWRNNANNADLPFGVNTSDKLEFNGTTFQPTGLTSAHILVGNGSGVATDVAMSGDVGIDNTGNTTIQSAVVTGAKIASNTITNSNINSAAAIAYSKLNLTGSIVNADIATSAAIVITKIANGTANQILGTNAGASANEWKTLTSTANQVTVTQGVGTVTFSTPQNIDTSAAVQFGTLALGGALDASSILSLTSTTKGFLPPSMTTTQKNAISTPTNGLVVYDSSLAQLFLRSGGAWTPLSTGGGSGTVSSGTANQLTYYAGTGTTVSGLTAITASRALASDTNGLPVASATLATELAFVSGVTSAIQTQLNLLAPKASPSFTGQILSANGTNVNPTYSFTSDTGTGMYRVASSDLGIAIGGTLQLEISATKFNSSLLMLAPNGLVGGPSYSFGNDQTTGIYRVGANQLGFATGGTLALTLDSAQKAIHNGNISFTTTSTQGIVGTTTNDSAAAGNVGEVVRSSVTSVALPTTTQFGDLTSISLTAGDWLVSGLMNYLDNSGTLTNIILGISTTTGNSSTGLVSGDNEAIANYGGAAFTAVPSGALAVPSYHLQLATTTTVYLKYSATYTGTPGSVSGRISAVRIR